MYEAYYESGMKPLNILQSATYLAAKSLNKQEEIGVLKSNFYADIIALKGDINKDFLSSIENIVFVMKDGKINVDKSNSDHF